MNTRSRPIDPHEAQHVAREFDMLQGLVVVAAGVGMTLYGLLFSSSSAIAVTAVAIIFVALGVDHFVQLPLLLSLLATAALLWVGIRLGARRLGMRPMDHVVLAVLAVLSLAPLAVGPHGDFPAVAFYFTLTGLALIVLGIGWHRRLIAVMGTPDDT